MIIDPQLLRELRSFAAKQQTTRSLDRQPLPKHLLDRIRRHQSESNPGYWEIENRRLRIEIEEALLI